MSSSTIKTMFNNLAIACRHMLNGPHGLFIRPEHGLSVLYGSPPPTIDLAIVGFHNHTDHGPLFDPTGRPWPERLFHSDERQDLIPHSPRLRRLFAAHGLTDTLSERTLAINAIYPNAPVSDAGMRLNADGSFGAWRSFSTSWTSVVLEQLRPKAILLLGRKAKLAIGHKLHDLPVVEAAHVATAAGADSEAAYDVPFDALKRLLSAAQRVDATPDRPFTSAELNEIYRYWLSKKAGRRMPSRRDIDPTEIPKLLRNLMLIDVARDPFRFGYRLIGTNVVDATGENRTGKGFDVVEFFATNPIVKDEYITVATTGEPLHSFEPFYRRDTRQAYHVERLLLPLSSDGVTVDMILAYFYFKSSRD